MNEIYWITRLEGIRIILIFTLVACFISLFVSSLNADNIDDIKNCVKKVIIPVAISIIGLVFIPSKQDMLLIYGLGGTIDYVQSNDKTQQLPDKVVDALDVLLENYINEESTPTN